MKTKTNRTFFQLPTTLIFLTVSLLLALVGCDTPAPIDFDADDMLVQLNHNNHLISESEEHIYFFQILTLKSLSKVSGEVTDVFEFTDPMQITFGVEYFRDRLYFKTDMGTSLVSVDLNGENLLKTSVDDPTQVFYTYGENLYYGFITPFYRVNPDTMELEPADSAVRNTFTYSEDLIFTKVSDENSGALYVKRGGGEPELFSEEDERTWRGTHFAAEHVFYTTIDLEDENAPTMSIYRVDLDGKNKKFITEVDMTFVANALDYDSEYLYVHKSEDEYLKINKQTLEETNIASYIDENYPFYEISDEKLFMVTAGQYYYIDTVTGEKVTIPIEKLPSLI